MAIRKNEPKVTPTDDVVVIGDDPIEDTPADTNGNVDVDGLTFVDALPPVKRSGGGGPGRSMSADTRKLIETLAANPNRFALLGTKSNSNPSPTLRKYGVVEKFRKNDEGSYDRFASYVGDGEPLPTKGQ